MHKVPGLHSLCLLPLSTTSCPRFSKTGLLECALLCTCPSTRPAGSNSTSTQSHDLYVLPHSMPQFNFAFPKEASAEPTKWVISPAITFTNILGLSVIDRMTIPTGTPLAVTAALLIITPGP